MNKKLLMVAGLMSSIFITLLQAPPVSSVPNASRVYADRFVPEVLPYQQVGTSGTLDATFGTSGSLDCSGQLILSQAISVKMLLDGSILVLLDNGVDTSMVVQYNASSNLVTTYGNGGSCTLSGLYGSQTMMLDSDNRLVVAGLYDEGGLPWIRRITAAGEIDPNFALINGQNWAVIGAIAEQTSGRYIMVGSDQATGYGKMTAYTQSGTIDTTFGNQGTVLFDGGTGHPLCRTPLYTVSIGQDNSIFVGYKNGAAYLAKFTMNGALATSFNPTGTLPGVLPHALGNATTVVGDQIRIVLSSDNNLTIAGLVGQNILVNQYDSITGAVIENFNLTTIDLAGDHLALYDFIALSDGSFLIFGSDTSAPLMMIAQVTATGGLSGNFNPTSGILLFTAPGSFSASTVLSGAVSPDGRIYAAGFQTTSSEPENIPYVSRVYNELYISAVPQYPATQEQGDFDLTFGSNSSETFRGINYLFNGNYGATLQQQTDYVIELAYGEENNGKLLVGMQGKLNTSSNSNTMLTRLNADGTLDTSFNGTGKLALPMVYDQEYISMILEDQNGNILVAGYGLVGEGDGGAFLRKYLSDGTFVWDADTGEGSHGYLIGSGYQGLSVGIQSSQRIILFMATGDYSGKMVAINPADGTIDVDFNPASNTPGQITPLDFDGALQYMGPLYGSAIDVQNNILIAYQNNDSGNIDVAYFYQDGSSFVTTFGSYGILYDVILSIAPTNVRLAIDNDARFVVVATTGNLYIALRYFIENGVIDPSFGSEGFVNINVGSPVALSQVTILDNTEIILTGSVYAGDYAMLLLRLTQSGQLDTAFNPKGKLLVFYQSRLVISFQIIIVVLQKVS